MASVRQSSINIFQIFCSVLDLNLFWHFVGEFIELRTTCLFVVVLSMFIGGGVGVSKEEFEGLSGGSKTGLKPNNK